MHIGIFGGTFDPPHLGHQKVVNTVLTHNLFDEVWYMPVAVHDPQFEKPWMSGVAQRLALLQMVVDQHQARDEAVRIETIELDENMEGLTHRTLRELAKRHPKHRFSFIMGSDQLAKLHLWGCDLEAQCFPKAFLEFEWYVYPRGGSPIESLPFSELKIIHEVEPVDISSTAIRSRVKERKSIASLVYPEVAEYIKLQKLYTQ